ncbi:mechanosensitive ion channel family protein [Desulfotignum phosphitoxidans]|uniref:Mechanosensitive ion channe, MscS n=1 Tax=Desulfotignum phosphitoxidans DSM 13687 TaxID=1286635 RepID=S0G425_9BACT|nr:mechanosensitive ion channel domain-containing protein [Desulfotignum phosphitoxidans]EMS80254.1 mechanosensitive ion channe, MscS [Desulfotignum phosphitoxidans DSM 13687]
MNRHTNKLYLAMRYLSILSLILTGVLFFMTEGIVAAAGVEENAGNVSEVQQMEAQFLQAMEQTQKDIAGLESELVAETRNLEEDERQNKIYQTRMTFLKNLVIMSGIGISELEKGMEEIDLSLSLIQNRLQIVRQRSDKFRQTLLSTTERAAMLDQVRGEAGRLTDQEASVVKEYREYQSVLEKKQAILKAILEVLSDQESINQNALDAFEQMRDRLKQEIAKKEGGRLLQRIDKPYSLWQVTVFKQELIQAVKKMAGWLNPSVFREKWSLMKSQTAGFDVMVFAGLCLAAVAGFRGMAVLRSQPRFVSLTRQRIGYPLLLIQDCLPLLIGLGIVFVLSRTGFNTVFPDLIQFLQPLLVVVLLTRVTRVAVRLAVEGKPAQILAVVLKWQPFFIWGIRIFAFLLLFIHRFISFKSALLSPLFFSFELLLIAGVFLFFRDIDQIDPPPRYVRGTGLFFKTCAVAGLMADIAGYSFLAAYWYISWGITIAVASVTLLLIYSIQDVDQTFKQAVEPETGNTHGVSYPFYWILSNGIYLIIGVLVFVALVFSWGAGDRIFPFLSNVVTREYSLGKFQLSFSGLMFAFVVILTTYAIVQIWKQVMAEKILKKSGLSTGARESILTLSGYVVWALGILLSLTAFGLNTTSLAVVFGALSIGLGFGLQNIFNNFISGLILLFERPIQVGDVVEVGGTWGEVLKINVRSTLVQTYDNSTLIIPNSEFISSRVTNWSHRDPYIRRDLLVGVAYGSDTALVEQLLLEAADHVKEVVQYPRKAVVQFIDFGESSLDFRLRFWSTINDFLTAETRLRFEIDRLFRENSVEIPFPQRDIHMKA